MMNIFKKFKPLLIIFFILDICILIAAVVILKHAYSGKNSSSSFCEVGAVECSTSNTWHQSYKYLNGEINKGIEVNSGEELVIKYSSEVKEGTLKIIFIDENNKEVKNILEDSGGVFKYKVNKDGTCHFQVIGDKTKGQFNLDWNSK